MKVNIKINNNKTIHISRHIQTPAAYIVSTQSYKHSKKWKKKKTNKCNERIEFICTTNVRGRFVWSYHFQHWPLVLVWTFFEQKQYLNHRLRIKGSSSRIREWRFKFENSRSNRIIESFNLARFASDINVSASMT